MSKPIVVYRQVFDSFSKKHNYVNEQINYILNPKKILNNKEITNFMIENNLNQNEYDQLTYLEILDKINSKEKNTNNYIKNQFDYINNDDKTQFYAFNNDFDKIKDKEYQILFNEFNKANKKGCRIYKGVFSFDNEALSKLGIYDIENNKIINNVLMKNAIKKAMRVLEEQSRINLGDLVYMVNYHFNTKNFHAHVIYVDKEEYQRKDKNKMVCNKKCFRKMKSVIINEFYKDKELLKDINVLRNNLRNSKQNLVFNEKGLLNLYAIIGKKLFYGYNATYKKTDKNGNVVKIPRLNKEEKELIRNMIDNIINENTELSLLFNEYKECLIHLQEENKIKYGDNVEDGISSKLEEIYTSFAKELIDQIKTIYNNKENKELFNKIDNIKKNKNLLIRNIKISSFTKNLNNYNFAYSELVFNSRKYLLSNYYSKLRTNINFYEANILKLSDSVFKETFI
ncbi:MAG: relaxase MobL [Methanobrevibacter sp.]|jgi:hemoglobin-like flavoprotein|nr:relaxase MobL [Candidatus Methanovirga meridionalis]